jgi:SspJ family small acid-soluble spore protein
MSAIITVRVDKKTKDKIKKHRINVSETVRKALNEQIEEKEQEELRGALREAGKILRKIPEKEIVRAVRESREKR